MTLQPSQPPGHRGRKARGHATDIARLHKQGYSLDAIRQALAEAGIVVSRSTVWRELMRPARPEALLAPSPAPSIFPVAPSAKAAPPQAGELPMSSSSLPAGIDATPPPRAAQNQLVDGDRNGKDIAAEFMKGRHTNPLLRNRI